MQEKCERNAPGDCEAMQPMPNVRCGEGFGRARSKVTNLFGKNRSAHTPSTLFAEKPVSSLR
jgi:hypothetical protein